MITYNNTSYLPFNEGITAFNEGDLLRQNSVGFQNHLFGLWIIYIVFIIVDRYKTDILGFLVRKNMFSLEDAMRIINIWDNSIWYAVVVIALYYPVVFLLYT